MSNNYANLRREFGQDTQAAKRCAQRLLAIRKRQSFLRELKDEGSLLLATWNIRDFDSNKFGFGPRLPESYYYIAEMLSRFDLVAVQEVNRDLGPLERLVRILGKQWDYIATDTTEGAGGNGERMAFVFNRDKVWFRKVAGEVVLPEGQLVVAAKKVKPPKGQPVEEASAPKVVGQQFARSPFLVTFQSGWFRFSLCTVHIYYGRDSGAELQRRIDEINRLVKFFAERQDKESKQEKDRRGAVENYILLGDFNVVSPEHQTMAALKSEGFMVPAEIDGKKVRKDGDHFYDQIAVRVKDPRFKVTAGGMLNMYEDVFRDDPEDLALYQAHMPATDPESDERTRAKTPQSLYRKWRTWQMSDHSPLWIRIDTDFSDQYLGDIAASA